MPPWREPFDKSSVDTRTPFYEKIQEGREESAYGDPMLASGVLLVTKDSAFG